jgi:hypothetical protein
VRPGGLLAYLAICLRFIFGSDLVGAYTQALLVKAVQDIKEFAEKDAEKASPSLRRRLSRNGGSNGDFLGADTKTELENKVAEKQAQVHRTENLIVDAFDPDKKLLLSLQSQLRELAKLQQELKAFVGGGAVERPKSWGRRRRRGVQGGSVAGISVLLLLFAAVQAAMKVPAVERAVAGLVENEWEGTLQVEGYQIYLATCAFVGLLKLIFSV